MVSVSIHILSTIQVVGCDEWRASTRRLGACWLHSSRPCSSSNTVVRTPNLAPVSSHPVPLNLGLYNLVGNSKLVTSTECRTKSHISLVVDNFFVNVAKCTLGNDTNQSCIHKCQLPFGPYIIIKNFCLFVCCLHNTDIKNTQNDNFTCFVWMGSLVLY